MLYFRLIDSLKYKAMSYYRVIALILVYIVLRCDIKGCKLALHPLISQLRVIFPNNSAETLLLYSYKCVASFSIVCSLKIGISVI